MEQMEMNDEVFYKLKKMPIVNQRDSVRVYILNNQEYIVKQLKRQEGKEKSQINDQREIDVALRLQNEKDNTSKYIVKIYKTFETEKFYYLVMEKCDGSLEDLFRKNEIINQDWQVRTELIIKLFYQIIQGYRYIKSLFPNFIHRDLCLDNIFYKKTNEQYVAQIADYGVVKLYDQTLTVDFKRKQHYMPPEAKKDKGTGQYDDKLDVYTLGVCLYKMMFGMTAQVEYYEQGLQLPSESKEDSYCNFISLLNQMLEQNSQKRISWKQDLFQLLLFEFPQTLSMKGRDDKFVTDCQSYLIQRLEQHPLSQLLDAEMKEIALRFKKLLSNKDLKTQQRFIILTVMKHVFEFQTKVDPKIKEDKLEEKFQKLRSAKYIAMTAYEIQLSFISKDDRFDALLSDFNQQKQIYKSIKKPNNLELYFDHFKTNKIDKNIESSCKIF